MSYECQHCKRVFTNKYNMKNHQKTAKYCLKLQGTTVINLNKFKCDGCDKSFTRKNHYTTHISTCKEFALKKKDDEIRELKKKRDNEIKELRKVIKSQKRDYENKIEKLQDRIQELAKIAIEAPRTTNNTNNTNILNLTPFNIEDDTIIKNKINELYNIEYLKRGQRGVAEFTKDNILLDDEGKLKYICSDPARLIFRYKDESGVSRKDVKANKLSKKITPNILKKASNIITNEISGVSETDELLNAMDSYKGIYDDIKKMDSNPNILGTELSQLTTA